MKLSSIKVSESIDLQVKYLIKSGLYFTQKEVVQDALRSLFLIHPQYKIEVAIKAYEDGEVSLAKAGEMAGLNYEEMRDILVQRGIKLKLGCKNKKEAKEEVRAIKEALGK